MNKKLTKKKIEGYKKFEEARKNPKVTKAWEYKKRKCVILWMGGHYNAYVETKLDISYNEGLFGDYDYESSPSGFIDGHCGLTYSGTLIVTPFEKDIKFFGVDYAHHGDCVEGLWEEGHKWTLNEVEKQTEEMANSIIDYERRYKKAKPIAEEFKKKIGRIFKRK